MGNSRVAQYAKCWRTKHLIIPPDIPSPPPRAMTAHRGPPVIIRGSLRPRGTPNVIVIVTKGSSDGQRRDRKQGLLISGSLVRAQVRPPYITTFYRPSPSGRRCASNCTPPPLPNRAQSVTLATSVDRRRNGQQPFQLPPCPQNSLAMPPRELPVRERPV